MFNYGVFSLSINTLGAAEADLSVYLFSIICLVNNVSN